MKKLVLYISSMISFVIFLILLLVTNHMVKNQDSQQMAARWSKENDVAQVSCFFSSNVELAIEDIVEFEYYVNVALQEASITSNSENENARLWTDAYSADGQITLSSDRAELQADAIGVGGDFFLFHPLKLLYGSYFSGNDLNQDYCIIDENAAWQLFGSNNVVGMKLYAGDKTLIISGVVEHPDGQMEEYAGLSDTLVYVSYQTLYEQGRCNGINHYEIVMPNPVEHFALNFVMENMASDEKETEIVENTSRYSLVERVRVLAAYGSRSMNGKAIIYPYWENIARGYEDIIALLTLFMVFFLLYPVSVILILLIIRWRNKRWTLRDVWRYVRTWVEEQWVKARKKAKKE